MVEGRGRARAPESSRGIHFAWTLIVSWREVGVIWRTGQLADQAEPLEQDETMVMPVPVSGLMVRVGGLIFNPGPCPDCTPTRLYCDRLIIASPIHKFRF